MVIKHCRRVESRLLSFSQQRLVMLRWSVMEKRLGGEGQISDCDARLSVDLTLVDFQTLLYQLHKLGNKDLWYLGSQLMQYHCKY